MIFPDLFKLNGCCNLTNKNITMWLYIQRSSGYATPLKAFHTFRPITLHSITLHPIKFHPTTFHAITFHPIKISSVLHFVQYHIYSTSNLVLFLFTMLYLIFSYHELIFIVVLVHYNAFIWDLPSW